MKSVSHLGLSLNPLKTRKSFRPISLSVNTTTTLFCLNPLKTRKSFRLAIVVVFFTVVVIGLNPLKTRKSFRLGEEYKKPTIKIDES